MPAVDAGHVLLALGLALFFGFAFESFYAGIPNRPGGVRTFPLLALSGLCLYLLEPRFAMAFVAGLLIIGAWIYAYLRSVLRKTAQEAPPGSALVIPACNIFAYALGALALVAPQWLSLGVTVAAVLILTERSALHAWTRNVAPEEIFTAGRFLLLTGVVLPLLAPLPPVAGISPFKAWLAVVAISTLSYASYLVQRYVLPGRGALVAAALGGLYSSTATTVVFAREAHEHGMFPDMAAGILLATAMMYVRMLAVVAVFNLHLATALALPALALAVATAVLAFVLARGAAQGMGGRDMPPPGNPLQLTSAFIFAVLFVVVSLVTTWVRAHLNGAGVFALAAVVGVTDIDPFVLSLAQGASVGGALAVSAILVAASSNNLLKAAYTVAFAHRRDAVRPAVLLAIVALLGIIAAVFVGRA